MTLRPLSARPKCIAYQEIRGRRKDFACCRQHRLRPDLGADSAGLLSWAWTGGGRPNGSGPHSPFVWPVFTDAILVESGVRKDE